MWFLNKFDKMQCDTNIIRKNSVVAPKYLITKKSENLLMMMMVVVEILWKVFFVCCEKTRNNNNYYYSCGNGNDKVEKISSTLM